jgi:prepilin-type N-terminal cleavage/methylation domain-containing protein
MKCIHQTGFTLLEMVLVITLIGILAITVVPKVNTRWFEQHGEFQQVLTALRYAHQIAIASECQVRVQVNGDTLSLYYNGVPTRCGSEAVISPIMGGAVKVKVNADIQGGGWIYNEQGYPLTGQQNLSIGYYNLRVEAVTGFVHVL